MESKMFNALHYNELQIIKKENSANHIINFVKTKINKNSLSFITKMKNCKRWKEPI